ncbi:hypothetical protein [Ligilactobacillus ruminis]|uniref:hypothetical protein n=1 Tax=Ligilactobacillus ruminis TaxID=1623 RepID=UPI001473B592|nr:hypothetical protein [Ligilactobacillus ruminis]NME32469.1 hypothetical protein [Ligilactobacillus ruminis]
MRQTKFRHFSRFLSTSMIARAILGAAVDKIKAFLSVFVYLDGRAPFLKDAVDKIKAFLSVFVYLDGRARHFLGQRQTKFRHFSRFLSTSMVARTIFEGCGRQNQGISLSFCLLRWSCAPFLKDAVDKIKAFLSIFAYFDDRARHFWRMR